ncbi:hypothetical protein BJV82DRAFT_657934 [Fennellomyces sp. T-0311]|nr:hypothetical protein BJV82DRAFT_657934 [Fennellomyces sp. T-0311]
MPFYLSGRPNQITFRGPIDLTRRSNGAKHNCLLFTFYHNGVTYEDARIGLQKGDIHSQHARSIQIDAIRQKSANDISNPDNPLVVEVHPETDSLSWVHLLLKQVEEEGDSMVWYRGNRDIRVNIQSTIPMQPVYYFYTMWNMPLGDPNTLCNDVKDAIIQALQKRYHLSKHVVDKTVVDIVAALSLDGNGRNPLYNGTFQIVLSTLQVQIGEDDVIPFYLYGDRYSLEEPTTHYIYCIRCKALDSHEHDEYNTFCSR